METVQDRDVLTEAVWEVEPGEFPTGGSPEAQARALLDWAILAPSSHNTQPWTFHVREGEIEIRPDPEGWLPVADPEKRELHLSVGCAVENLVVAARFFGLLPEVSYHGLWEEDGPAVRVRLAPSDDAARREGGPDPLFHAIRRRHTHHGVYDARPVQPETRQELEGVEPEPGTGIHLTDDPDVRRRVTEWTVRADALQFEDRAWRRELGRWMRRGVFGTGPLQSRVAALAVTHLDLGGSTGRKDARLLESAALLGVVCTTVADPTARIRAGRTFQRLALAATARGLVLQPMNQVLQVDRIRAELTELLPEAWGRPEITFRMGHAEPEEATPRHPFSEGRDAPRGHPD